MIKKSFFRERALENYQQSQIPKVMPKFIPPLITFLFWFFFLLLIGGLLEIWSYSPVHIEQGSGIILNVAAKALPDYGLTGHGSNTQTIAILLLPGQFKMLLHTGNVVQVQPEGAQQPLSGSIERIDTTAQTVGAARNRYRLGNQTLPNIPSSIMVALVGFDSSKVNTHYDKKPVTASIKVQIPSILYLFLTNQKLPGTG